MDSNYFLSSFVVLYVVNMKRDRKIQSGNLNL